MTDVKELVLAIVLPLVNRPEQVTLSIEESQDFFEYNLHLAPEDIGRVIGKQGRIIKAIRTIVYSVKSSHPKKVRLNILEEHEKSSETI